MRFFFFLVTFGTFFCTAFLEGAPKWSFVVIPDTQMYMEKKNFSPIFDSMLEWVAENKEALNIEAVFHVGDVTQRNNPAQWELARKSFSRLDGVVPYYICVGNHDLGEGGSANDRTTLFNHYFKISQNPLNEAGHLASFEPDRIENSAYRLHVNGEVFLILILEFGPRDEVLDWANSVVKNTEHDSAILLTHDFIDELSRKFTRDGLPERTTSDTVGSPYKFALKNDGTESNLNSGDDVWEKLVQGNDTFEFVFNGHHGDYWERSENGNLKSSKNDIATGYRADERTGGKTVHQVLFNAQFIWNGGNGWLQIFTFESGSRNVEVTTFSPYFQKRIDLGLSSENPWREGLDYKFSLKRD